MTSLIEEASRLENAPSEASPRVILEAGRDAGAFPGAVAHLSRAGTPVFEGAVGHLGYSAPFLRPVTPGTLYDLASLTKIYTLAAAFIVLRDAQIPLETSLRRFFPAFDARISLEHLMSHRSGISFPLQKLENGSAAEWLPRIAAAPKAPDGAVCYCCTNYFLLARVLEAVSGASLDALIEARILRPLHLENTVFEPSNLENVAPTEQNASGFYHGVVYDEAARSWRAQTGTCAGNAGLFATASDVAAFAALWSENGSGIVHRDDGERAFSSRWPENSYWRGLGWQFDAAFYLSERAPAGTAGHLGFTGPSLAVHRATGSVAVILSNRVHPTRLGPDRLPCYRQIARWLWASAGEAAISPNP